MVTLSLNRWLNNGHWLSLLMLLTLHFALWAGLQSIWARPLLFAHLGLFLMWQPLWRGEEKLRISSVVMILSISLVALFWLNWWVLAFWVSWLFSLVGGRVFAFQSVWQRVRYLLAMGYLLAVLLLWLTPQLFGLSTTPEASSSLMEIVLPLLLVLMILIPQERERLSKAVAVDWIYSLLLFLLLTLLVLGSLAFMSLGHVDYFQALLRTLFLMAMVLFVLGWLWLPRLGFSGLQVSFSRYFLNIGTPFEIWLRRLATIAEKEANPDVFIKLAMAHLAELPWLSGLSWECELGTGMRGEISQHSIEWKSENLRLILFTRQSVAPSVLMHINLLSQLLGYFYDAKQREQRMREMTRLQAVHETGARLTHDLKNMLQSLFALISIAEQKREQLQPILLNQLPVLAKQIEETLGKFKVPKEEGIAAMLPLATWWSKLQQRQHYRNLEWVKEGDIKEQVIPFGLFDSIVDNLIDNARNKRMREPDIKVRICLKAQPLSVSICDNGSAIPENIAKQLLRTVVDSEDGLGIGLYQAARWAEQFGYQLVLQENRDGKVCFELVKSGLE